MNVGPVGTIDCYFPVFHPILLREDRTPLGGYFVQRIVKLLAKTIKVLLEKIVTMIYPMADFEPPRKYGKVDRTLLTCKEALVKGRM